MLLYSFKNFTATKTVPDIPKSITESFQRLCTEYEYLPVEEIAQPLDFQPRPIVFYYLPSFASPEIQLYNDYRQQSSPLYIVLIIPKDNKNELKSQNEIKYEDYLLDNQLSEDWIERVLSSFEVKKESKQKLSKYIDLYNNLFTSSAIPMMVTCAYTNRIVMVNQATKDTISAKEEWLTQMNITELCHPDDMERMEKNMASRTGERTVVRWCLPENNTLHIEFSAYNIIVNEYPASLVIFTDITQLIESRERERSSLSQFETIFDKTQEAILVFDDDGQIIDANRSAVKLFRAYNNQLKVSKIQPLMTDGLKKSFGQIWQTFLEHNQAKGITKIRDFENNQLIASYQLHKKLIGGYHLATLLDITDNYQKNQETLCLNEIHRLLGQTQSFNEPFEMVLKRVCELAGYQTASLWVVDGAGKYLKNVSLGTHNFPESLSLASPIRIEHSVDDWEVQVFRHGQAMRGKQMREINGGKAIECNSFVLPLKSKHKVVGILSLCTQDVTLINKKHTSFCKSVADILGLKIVKLSALKDWDNVFNHSNNYICTIGRDGSFIKVNPRFCKELGFVKEEFYGKPFLQVVHPEDLGAARFDLDLMFSNNASSIFTNRCVAKDGTIHWIEWSATYESNTEIAYLIGKDITQEQSAKRQYLLEAENSGRILSSITDGYFMVNDQWRIQYTNKAAEQLFDLDSQSHMGMYLWEVFNIHPYHPFFMQHVVAQDENREHSFIDFEEHSKKWLSVSCNPLNDGMAISYRDISTLKEQESNIERMKSNLELLINNTDNYIWSIDTEKRFVTFNSIFAQRLAQKIGEQPQVGSEALNEKWSKEELTYWNLLYDRALAGESFFEEVSGFNPVKGEYEISEINLYPIYRDDEIIGVSCFSKDITEKEKYVRAIEEQNLKLREITWIQSHVVRAPLSRILGAVDLLMHDSQGNLPSAELLSCVDISAREMDEIIHEIVRKASPYSPDSKSPTDNLMVS
ncbi:PAS domain-containing protein [Flectobacillus roseus]|uniref:PAS domain-containing protein n=1 Tax=Flectobacillus roseus TaxID=502259 RepID=UPI0024B772AA|nr:PAS domain-containing protein [Flectobacillus roseus]MDI9867849.1 PAS domain-containing protein [Flectobacillus roseus]